MKFAFRVLAMVLAMSLLAGLAYGRDDEDVAVSELIKRVAGLSPYDQNAAVKPLLYGQRPPVEPDFTPLAKLGPRVVPLVGFAVGVRTIDSKTGKAIIERIGDKAIESMRKLLSDDNTDPRIVCGLVQIAGLQASGKRELIPSLLHVLENLDLVVSTPFLLGSVTKALSEMKVSAKELLPTARRIVAKKPDRGRHRPVIFMLGKVENPDEQTMAFLIELLKSAPWPTVNAAVDVLVSLGGNGKRASTVLLAVATDPDATQRTRQNATDAISEFGLSAGACYADVMKLSESATNAADKFRFLRAAARIGPEKDVAKLLHGIIKDGGKYALSAQLIYIRRFPSDKKALDAFVGWAAKATSHYQFAKAVKLLAKLADDGSKPAGETLLDLLEKTKPDPKRSEKLLKAVVSSAKPGEANLKAMLGHYLAVERPKSALVEMFRPFEAKAIEQFLLAADTADRKKRGAIALVLGSFSVEATVQLSRLLTSDNASRQSVAASALMRYSGISPKAIPFLRKALVSKNRMSSRSALIALKKLGPKASAAAADVWVMVTPDNRNFSAVLSTYQAIAPDADKKIAKLAASADYKLSHKIIRATPISTTPYASIWNTHCTSKSDRIRQRAFQGLSRAFFSAKYPGRPRGVSGNTPRIEQRKKMPEMFVKIIEKGLADKDSFVRSLAFNCVGYLACQRPEWARAILMPALRSDNSQLINSAAGGLSEAQDVLGLTVEDLIKIIPHVHRNRASDLVSCAGRAKPIGIDKARVLFEKLNDPNCNKSVAMAIATALGAMGPAGADMVEPIAKRIRQAQRISGVVWALSKALPKLGPVGQTALVDIYVEKNMPTPLYNIICTFGQNPHMAKLLRAKADQAKSTLQAKKLRDLARRIAGNPRTLADKQALQAFAKKNYADLLKTSN